MSDGIQHALLAVLIALAGLLEARRRRELALEAREERRELLRAAAERHVNDVDSSSEISSGSNETARPKDS